MEPTISWELKSMRKSINPFCVLIITFLFLAIQCLPVLADVYVHGYYRKDGTYVQPYYRSNPDGDPTNNWSYPGNINPYTGKVAPGNPSTYLNNYDSKYSTQIDEDYSVNNYDSITTKSYANNATNIKPESADYQNVTSQNQNISVTDDSKAADPRINDEVSYTPIIVAISIFLIYVLFLWIKFKRFIADR